MATNNSSNNQYVNNSDGFALGGGATVRTLTVTGGNPTITASGTNVYTMPSATDTLVGRASTDTLTNKTLTNPLYSGNSGAPSTPATGFATIFGIGTSNLRPGFMNQSGTQEWLMTSTVAAGAVQTTWTTFTPSLTGFTGTPTVTTAKYIQIGTTVFIAFDITGTSNATTMTFTLPVAPTANVSTFFRAVDNGGAGTAPGLLQVTSGSTTASLFKDASGTSWTNTGTKAVNGLSFSYIVG